MDNEFLNALAQLDPRLRKLLSDCRVQSQADLSKIDPWPLIHQRGVGRSLVRALATFMRQRGIEVPPTPLPPRRLAKLVVSFPDELAARVHERATEEQINVSALVVRI